MALDLYVGPVSRYIVGDWKTIGQQMAEAQGIAFSAVGPGVRQPPAPAEKERADQAYENWREQMRNVLAMQDDLTPLWDDSASLEYSTDRPGLEGLIALAVRYAYLLFPELPVPERISGPGRTCIRPGLVCGLGMP